MTPPPFLVYKNIIVNPDTFLFSLHFHAVLKRFYQNVTLQIDGDGYHCACSFIMQYSTKICRSNKTGKINF